MNKALIIGTADGKDITVEACLNLIAKKDKHALATLIYERLYRRYLKPFEYDDAKYTSEHKNGFAIMASCCLLIETYVSFTEKKYRRTKGKGKDCFEHFFKNEPRFSEIDRNSLAEDFYTNVRCGILHNAETRAGWTINRRESKYVDTTKKQINAVKFANRLNAVLKEYKQRLILADFDTAVIWKNAVNRLNDLISDS